MGARSSCLVGLACFLQVATATAIIVITALKLHKVSVGFDKQTYNADVSNVCLLGSTDNGANLCYFAYIAGGLSVIATGVLSILQCCTCNLCGLGSVLDALFAAAGTALWAIAGVIFNFYGRQPAMQGVPQATWRHSIPVLSFVACALFAIMCLASLWSMFSACCGCGGRAVRSASKGARGRRAGGVAPAPAGKLPPSSPPSVSVLVAPPQPAPYSGGLPFAPPAAAAGAAYPPVGSFARPHAPPYPEQPRYPRLDAPQQLDPAFGEAAQPHGHFLVGDVVGPAAWEQQPQPQPQWQQQQQWPAAYPLVAPHAAGGGAYWPAPGAQP